LVVPVTVAASCWVPFTFTVAPVGETVTATGVRVSVQEADCVGSACEVAVTTTVFGVGAMAGAVYRPDDVMVPQAVPVQPGPDTVQVTA
jgi:hypothetical protein